ncbi:MAG: Crp/Fnr family transcriptional regulator [Saprospiraceae bacterium]|nr:Crp/Fnr family transcriptional regulator [Saprospiraceae bacterium]
MDLLKNTILSHTPVPEDELNQILTCFSLMDLGKGEYLLKAEQYVQQMFFLQKGCISFYTIHEGREQVVELFTEGTFFTDLFSYLREQPSKCFLKALEPSEVLAASKEDFERSLRNSHAMEHFWRKSLEEEYLTQYVNSTNKNALSNEERYLRLLRKRPDLFQRVPQYLIASYLGLTPVGLSKIRKRLSQSH